MKMSDGSRLGQLLWDEDDLFGLHWGRMFWNQVKKKKKTERKETHTRKMCVEEKNKKKEEEMKREKGEII